MKLAVARQKIVLPPRAWTRSVGSWISGNLWEGSETEVLERRFAEFVGVPAAVAVPSARAGLRFVFEGLGLEPDSEVICSAFGYPVVPYLAKAVGLRPRFVDCELTTLGMDPQALADGISDRTRVVIATHLYGVPCRIDEIAEICRSKGALLIEDCAHCYGASVEGTKAGAFGTAAYFSFETSKMINTMGGGIVTLNDEALAGRVRAAAAAEPRKELPWLAKRLLKTSFEATVTHPFTFNLGVYPALRASRAVSGDGDRFASGYQGDEVSLAGRMGRFTNLQARLALDQLERVAVAGEGRRRNAERMMNALGDCVDFQRPAEGNVVPNYMLVTARFGRMLEVADRLLVAGIDTKHHYMRDCSEMFEGAQPLPNAAAAEREVLHLPAYPPLSEARIDRIAEKVRAVVSELGDVRGTPAKKGDVYQTGVSGTPIETGRNG